MIAPETFLVMIAAIIVIAILPELRDAWREGPPEHTRNPRSRAASILQPTRQRRVVPNSFHASDLTTGRQEACHPIQAIRYPK